MHLLSSGLWSGHSRWLFSRLTRACFTYTLLTCLRTHPTPASDCSYQKDGGGACPSASFPGNGWANLRLISALTGHLPVTPGAKAAPMSRHHPQQMVECCSGTLLQACELLLSADGPAAASRLFLQSENWASAGPTGLKSVPQQLGSAFPAMHSVPVVDIQMGRAAEGLDKRP